MFTDTCRITKSGGPKGEFDEATMKYDEPARIVVYGPGAVDDDGNPVTGDLAPRILAGKCRVQVRSDINANAVEAVVGEHEWTYRTAELQLPTTGTDAIQSEYVVEILTCMFNPDLVGSVFAMQTETKGKSHGVYRRYRIRELIS